MPIVAILVSGLAGAAFGLLWFRRFGAVWREAAGLSEADWAQRLKSGRPYMAAVAANLIVAGAMRHILASGGFSGPFWGLTTGFEIGACIAAPWIAMATVFAGRPLRLAAIEAGHVAGACTAIGLVLGLFV